MVDEIADTAPEKRPTIGIGRVRRGRRITMTDVARAAGCSQSTVSFVLNDNRTVQISEATRERVKRVASELGYEGVNPREDLATSPVAPGVVDFVIDNLSTSPESVVAIEGVRQAVRASGNDHIVLVAETQNDPKVEPRTLSMFIEQNVSAIIYACIFTRKVELPQILRETAIPVLLLNCYTEDHLRPAVVPSEIAGGQVATQALIDAGHTRIATITGETFMEAAQDRLSGYRIALASADIPFNPSLVVEGDWSASAGFRATKELLELPKPPTAIFCQNDRMAIGCYEALKENGWVIPRDMSVIGYDDEEIARHLFPPLTTLVLPHRAMGRWAMEHILYGAIDAQSVYPLTKLECPLVERNSIAPPLAG
jgi:LacI family transcriptional regulator